MTLSDKMLKALRSALKGIGENVACPECGALVHRPVGTESVCGPHGHKVPATMVIIAKPWGKPAMLIVEHVKKAAQ